MDEAGMGGAEKELSAQQRREKILHILGAKGRVRVSELARGFGTSEVTIRHDLAELEEQSLLYRVHGGAESAHRAYYTLSLADRMKRNEQAKRQIAIKAAALVGDGETVLMDSGTTTLMIAQELRQKKALTVVTNSLMIAREMTAAADASVILLGGNLNSSDLFAYGDDTYAQLQRYKANKMIMAVDGISAESGITTYYHLEAEVTRRMSERAGTVIVAADYTKIGREGFANIGGIEIADILITNTHADKKALGRIAAKNIEVITV
jgi:DeoR family fructose operon transcriptional repressor